MTVQGAAAKSLILVGAGPGGRHLDLVANVGRAAKRDDGDGRRRGDGGEMPFPGRSSRTPWSAALAAFIVALVTIFVPRISPVDFAGLRRAGRVVPRWHLRHL